MVLGRNWRCLAKLGRCRGSWCMEGSGGAWHGVVDARALWFLRFEHHLRCKWGAIFLVGVWEEMQFISKEASKKLFFPGLEGLWQ